ncbi:MAG: hypothetical protein AAF203_01740, partial [Pseudomonadota bacterium]
MRNHLDQMVLSDPAFSLSLTSPQPVESIAYYLATSAKLKGPQLVITEDMEKAQHFLESYSFWTQRKAHLLPGYDPSAFSGVQIRPSQVADRLSWLSAAINENENHVFVAPILGLLQKTLPTDLFYDQCVEFSVGDDLPDDFFEKLYQMGYQANPVVEDRGRFSNRGGLVDIFSPQMTSPVRLELFGQEIESLRLYDPGTQRTIREVDSFLVIPAREVLLTKNNAMEAMQKLLPMNQPELQDRRRRRQGRVLEAQAHALRLGPGLRRRHEAL